MHIPDHVLRQSRLEVKVVHHLIGPVDIYGYALISPKTDCTDNVIRNSSYYVEAQSKYFEAALKYFEAS